MQEILEGQIFEGPVSALGGEGPQMRWIVVSPHGRAHAHCLSDPLDLHCMPLGIMRQAIAEGRLSLVETRLDHPVLRLQRAKEELGLEDTHMGLHGHLLRQMLKLLETAAAQGADYAPYLAGEILALFAASRYTDAEAEIVRSRVWSTIGRPDPGGSAG